MKKGGSESAQIRTFLARGSTNPEGKRNWESLLKKSIQTENVFGSKKKM